MNSTFSTGPADDGTRNRFLPLPTAGTPLGLLRTVTDLNHENAAPDPVQQKPPMILLVDEAAALMTGKVGRGKTPRTAQLAINALWSSGRR